MTGPEEGRWPAMTCVVTPTRVDRPASKTGVMNRNSPFPTSGKTFSDRAIRYSGILKKPASRLRDHTMIHASSPSISFPADMARM